VPLRTGQTNRHRRLRHQKMARDVMRRHPADRTQRQHDPRLERECRMTAGEDQPQTFVRDGSERIIDVASDARFSLVFETIRHDRLRHLAFEGAMSPLSINRLSASSRDRLRDRANQDAITTP